MNLSTVQRQQAVLPKAVAGDGPDGPGGVDLQGLRPAGEREGEGPAAILGAQNEGGP